MDASLYRLERRQKIDWTATDVALLVAGSWKSRQAGMTLVGRCHAMTKTFPRDERFGLAKELRRAPASIPRNVAEGRCRYNTNVFANYTNTALGGTRSSR